MAYSNILAILALLATSCQPPSTETASSTNKQEAQLDSTLVTGWYYLSAPGTGYKRKLDRDTTFYYIDPTPIVTAKNIVDYEIYLSNFGDYGLAMQLDNGGSKAWKIATGKSIGKKLALIVDDNLVYTPLINDEIDGGMTALNRKMYTIKELESFRKRIKE